MTTPDEENQLSEVSTLGSAPSGSSNDGNNVSTTPGGYHVLSDLMERSPTMGVFRRFGKLNALNLLFYQAELMKLETRFLNQLECDEKSEDPHLRELGRDWNAASATDVQQQLMVKIRGLLEKYSK